MDSYQEFKSGDRKTRLFNHKDSLLFYLFLALVIWLPLPLGSNRPWAWSIMEIWVMFIACGWCYLYITNDVRVPITFGKCRSILILFLLLLFFISSQLIPLPSSWMTVISPNTHDYLSLLGKSSDSLSVSLDPYATKVGLLKSITYFAIFCLTILLINTRTRLRILAYVLVLSGLFQAVYGALMTLSGLGYGFFILSDNALGGRAAGTFVNSNNFAGYLEMIIAIGVGLLIASFIPDEANSWKGRLRRLLQLLISPKAIVRLSLVIMVIALVLSRSRMGNTAFFSSLFIAGTIGLILSRHAPRSVAILLVSLIIIDIFIVGSWFGLEKVKQRLEQTSLVTEQRDDVYGYTVKLWDDYPLMGTGLGSFYSTFPKYRGKDINGFAKFTENDYLQILAETGIIGFMIFALIVSLSLLAALKAHYVRRDPLARGMSFAVIMGMTAILIHASVEFNLQIPANAATFVILLALGWISLSLKPKGNYKKRRDGTE